MQSARVHFILFSLVSCNAAATGYALVHRDSSFLEWLIILLFFFAVGTLIYQRKKDFSKTLKRLAWAALAYVGYALATFIYGLVVFVRSGGTNRPLDHAELIPVGDSLYVALSLLSILLALAIGVPGMFTAKRNRIAQTEIGD